MKYRGYILGCAGLSALLLLSTAMPTLASSGAKALPEGVNYIAVEPPLVVNYGGPGKMRYIKAEFSIRAESSHDATEITHHLPLVRDRLINLLSAQTAEKITTAEGKEQLRVMALTEINGAIHAIEAGKELVSHIQDASHKATDKHAAHGDEHPTKGDSHDAAATDKHAKPKQDKGEHAKNDKSKENHDDAQGGDHAEGPATDLLFTNFVIQQ